LTGGSIGYVHHGVGLRLGTVGYGPSTTLVSRGLTAKSERLFRTGLNFEQKYTALSFTTK
jgi:hypothetical protein